MNCPKCKGSSVKTIGSYTWKDGVTVTRHKLCRSEGCWLKFKSLERVLPSKDYSLPRQMLRPRSFTNLSLRSPNSGQGV